MGQRVTSNRALVAIGVVEHQADRAKDRREKEWDGNMHREQQADMDLEDGTTSHKQSCVGGDRSCGTSTAATCLVRWIGIYPLTSVELVSWHN